MSDEELDRLVSRFCGGDLVENKEAFTTIRNKCVCVPYGIFYRGLPAHLKSEAEFHALEVMNRLWKFHDRLDVDNGIRSLIAWLTKTAIHLLSDILKKRSSVETGKDSDWWKGRHAQQSDPTEQFEANDSLRWLIETKLNANEKAAVRGILSEKPVDEIANELGLAPSTVYGILDSARKKMKDSWDDAFGAG